MPFTPSLQMRGKELSKQQSPGVPESSDSASCVCPCFRNSLVDVFFSQFEASSPPPHNPPELKPLFLLSCLSLYTFELFLSQVLDVSFLSPDMGSAPSVFTIAPFPTNPPPQQLHTCVHVWPWKPWCFCSRGNPTEALGNTSIVLGFILYPGDT